MPCPLDRIESYESFLSFRFRTEKLVSFLSSYNSAVSHSHLQTLSGKSHLLFYFSSGFIVGIIVVIVIFSLLKYPAWQKMLIPVPKSWFLTRLSDRFLVWWVHGRNHWMIFCGSFRPSLYSNRLRWLCHHQFKVPQWVFNSFQWFSFWVPIPFVFLLIWFLAINDSTLMPFIWSL